jgi:hypothetical protein
VSMCPAPSTCARASLRAVEPALRRLGYVVESTEHLIVQQRLPRKAVGPLLGHEHVARRFLTRPHEGAGCTIEKSRGALEWRKLDGR